MPCHKLIQDVTTRWDSTHDMLTRFLEQKWPITLYVSESETSSNLTLLTKHQWLLLVKVVLVLDQFAVMTKIISSASTHISYVIPSLAALICFLETDGLHGSANSAENTAGIRTMRSELVKALLKRFQTRPTDDLHRKPAYAIATALDPRYKLNYFKGDVAEWCKSEIQKLMPRPANDDGIPDKPVEENNNGPAEKCQKIGGFLDCFALAAVSSVADREQDEQGMCYLSLPHLTLKLKWLL